MTSLKKEITKHRRHMHTNRYMHVYICTHTCVYMCIPYVYTICIYIILRYPLGKSKLIQHMAEENHICITCLVNFLLLLALEKSLV